MLLWTVMEKAMAPHSCLENPTDRGAWWAAVHGVAGSRTQLSDFTFTFHFYALEKEMSTNSSILVWRSPGTGEPSGLPSVGSHRVGHDWSDLAAAAVAHTPRKEQSLVLNSYYLWSFLDRFIGLCRSAMCFISVKEWGRRWPIHVGIRQALHLPGWRHHLSFLF